MKPAGIILRFIFCHRWQAGTASGIRARSHKDFAGFQVEAQGKSRTFFGSEDSRRRYKQLTPLSLQMHQSALARKSGGRGAACARIASDFLDFLVLFRQGKSTIKIQGNKRLEFVYGPDQSRKIMKYYEKEGGNFVLKKTKYYILGNTEKEVDNVTGEIRTLNYISGKAILEQTSSGINLYYLHKDYQGTTLAVTDASGSVVQRFAYDPWGRKRDPGSWRNYTASEIEQQNFLFARGYTGHEHLDAFGLINMLSVAKSRSEAFAGNGRMYDPLLGRMLSPDNYVQAPDNSQNFNRYSYSMNNPLVYTDPSGEFLLPAIMLAAYINASVQLISGNVNSMGDFALSIGIGAASGAAGAGVGSAISSIAGGAIGFGSGAISGAAGGFAGGFVGGAGNAWANGADFSDGLTAGLVGGGWGALGGAVIGGITGGIRANKMGLDFWDGTGTSVSESQVVVTNDMVTRGSPTGINDSKSLYEFQIDNFEGSDGIGVSYGNEHPTVRNNGFTVDASGSLTKQGRSVSGITIATKTSMFGDVSTLMAISPNAAVYSNNLRAVLGHELIHVYHYQTGFMSKYGKSTSEYYAYKYSASCISSNKLNYALDMKYIWCPKAVKIPFGFKTVYPGWVPKSVLY
jgi:RHS repeat-associated protein